MLNDDLNPSLLISEPKIVVEEIFNFTAGDDINKARQNSGMTRSMSPAKTLTEFFEMVQEAINNYETRALIDPVNKVLFTEEEPDKEAFNEAITFSVLKREPGSFSQGSPFEGKIKNLKPMFRESGTDPENPGYRYATYGYWHDNLVRFTCWARTNKAANKRAFWFEDLMDEYNWWFRLQGVDRVIFWGRQSDITVDAQGNIWYGRPIDFYVKTENIKVFSEKKIEQILIKVSTKSSL